MLPRERILEAVLTCIGRYGIAKTKVEDVVRVSEMSRATVYRHFPGGRDQLISECITWEVGRFFSRLGAQVADAPDFATRLERGLMLAHQGVADHQVLQKVLETEPERFLPQLSMTGPLVIAVLRGYFEPLLQAEPLAEGCDAESAADYLARMMLSFMVGQGRWDLTDAAEVRRLVRGELLAGILAWPGETDVTTPNP